MDPQAQTSGVGSLDPDVVNLAKAIRQTESGGNFNAKGKSGEYGAYQFTEPTWAIASKKYLGQEIPLQQATPEQQNQVAYSQIKEWKDAGNNVGQIASMWNAGEKHKDAYLDTSYKGVNQYGANYNVPAYAKSVATAYHTLKQGGQVGADPNNPSSTAAPQNQPPSLGGFLGNVVSSGQNFVGGIANAIMHPIKTVEGLGNIAGGALQLGAGALTGQKMDTPQTQALGNVVQFFGQRYGGSNPQEVLQHIAHTAYTDPVGFAADLSVLMSGGAAVAGKIGTAADIAKGLDIANTGGTLGEISAAEGASNASRLASGLGRASEYVNPITAAGKVAGKVSDVVGRATALPLGVSTGVGSEPIVQGFRAASAGGDARQAFLQGLRGSVGPDELVAQAKNATAQLVADRNASYQSMLSKLKADPTTYDISPVIREVNTQLKRFNITKNPDGTLDFSRSAIGEGADATKIQQVYDDLKSWGTKPGDRTALGIDILKKRIGNYYSPNSDIRAFITSAKSSVKSVLDNAPGYTPEMKNYSNLTDQIDEANKALSLGDRATVETAFKKLTSSLKNNDVRKQIIQELDQATGGNLLAGVAGQRLSSIMPRGITAAIEAGAGGSMIAGLGAGGILPLLGMAMTTSPRLVGEITSALGLGTMATARLMRILTRFRTPITGTGIMGNLINNQVSNPAQ